MAGADQWTDQYFFSLMSIGRVKKGLFNSRLRFLSLTHRVPVIAFTAKVTLYDVGSLYLWVSLSMSVINRNLFIILFKVIIVNVSISKET